MTDKDIKKLSRSDLLELLIEQKKENDQLKAKLDDIDTDYEAKIAVMKEEHAAEITALKEEYEDKIAEIEADCEERIEACVESVPVENKVEYEEIGSLAESALKLNSVFEAADAAAKQYLDTIILNNEAQVKKAEQLVADAEEKANLIVAKAELESQNSHAKADAYWAEISEKLEKFYDDHRGLREMMKFPTEN